MVVTMAALGVDGDDGDDLDDGGADVSGAESGDSDGGKGRGGGGGGDGAEHWDGGDGADDRCGAGDSHSGDVMRMTLETMLMGVMMVAVVAMTRLALAVTGVLMVIIL